MFHYLVLDQSLHQFADNWCQAYWSIVTWLFISSFLVNRCDVGFFPLAGYFAFTLEKSQWVGLSCFHCTPWVLADVSCQALGTCQASIWLSLSLLLGMVFLGNLLDIWILCLAVLVLFQPFHMWTHLQRMCWAPQPFLCVYIFII